MNAVAAIPAPPVHEIVQPIHRVSLQEPKLKKGSRSYLAHGSSPEVSWYPVRYAKGYRVQVSDTPNFSHQIADENVFDTHYRIRKMVPGRLFWRVKAVGAGESSSSYSNPGYIDVKLLAPILAGSYQDNKEHLLAWTAVPQAEKYIVRYSEDANIMSNVTEKITDRAQLTLDMKSKPVYVEVAAANAGGERVSDFSMVAAIQPAKDQNVPEIISPNGSRVAIGNSGKLTVVFSWTPIPNATDYLIEIANDSDFKDIIDRHEVKPAKYVVKNRNFNGHVFWRVRTTGPGIPSSWSTPGRFEVIIPKLAQDS